MNPFDNEFFLDEIIKLIGKILENVYGYILNSPVYFDTFEFNKKIFLFKIRK
jgi:cysteinyl-tRNA synthetase